MVRRGRGQLWLFQQRVACRQCPVLALCAFLRVSRRLSGQRLGEGAAVGGGEQGTRDTRNLIPS